ncbi:uncharacterized protein LOC125226783 [Leguminivora glycinivorella]|uniref:uncharacterized protein LOC125226783 n=1 Tax=Leguminivora glycinivorella TaxID=1035111 RepID=UPI0020107D15|nr:uncharacterized protein LOC125226783 [Leguminivora glycinivorella]
MNMTVINMKLFVFIIFSATGYCLNITNETDEMSLSMDMNETDARKRYGYGFYGPCDNYRITFLCMTNCKSLGYEVYRLDRSCKCTCHEMRSTMALPYYKWYTTDTPKRVPTTRSARLWDVVGTLSPHPIEQTTTPEDNNTCPTFPTINATESTGNETEVTTSAGDGSNTTEATNATSDGPDTNGTNGGNEDAAASGEPAETTAAEEAAT